MPSIAPLSATYAEAREAFLTAAHQAGASRQSFPHPLLGLQGEDLAVDVAELGPEDAADVVVIVSATHGVEGYCGSALQTHWLAHHSHERPAQTRIVLIHGLNPYGFSWVRRVNEDNVDLNRNFPDWSAPLPANDDYSSIANLLVPTQWTDEVQTNTTTELLVQAGTWGMDKLQAVISGGQYTHPDGLFYGGTGPTWSHIWLHQWCAQSLGSAQRVHVIDLHTGLGPWGVGELIGKGSPGDPGFDRAVKTWGDVRSVSAGDSVSAEVQGDWNVRAADFIPNAEVTAVAIEYGVVDVITVLQSLRADAWLHTHGNPTAPSAASIRAQVRGAFADDDPAWIGTCWTRFHQVLNATYAA